MKQKYNVVDELKIKAEQGDMYAQVQLGLRYQYGREVEKNYEEAEKYFQLAADQGYRNAETNLILLYKMMGIPLDRLQKKITPLHLKSGNNSAQAAINSSKTISIPIPKIENVNTKDENDWTALHYAARFNNLEATITLIANGADIHACAYFGGTPIQLAAANGNLALVKLLVQAGALIDDISGDGDYTPLLHALGSKNIEVAHYLITECNADIHYISDNNDANALTLALLANDVKLVELILDRFGKFKPYFRILDNLKTIPDSIKVLKLVLTKGWFSQKCDFSKPVLDEFHTFFIKALTMTNDFELMSLLLEKGLPANIVQLLSNKSKYKGFDPKQIYSKKDFFTSLGLAMACHNETLVKSLLENGAEFIPHLAIIEELKDFPSRLNIYKLILTVGSFAQKCHFKDDNFNEHLTFFLQVVFSEDHGAVMSLLLAKGLSPNTGISIGGVETKLLVQAIDKGCAVTTQILLAKGANADALDQSGRTALIMAAKHGHGQIAANLLTHGANPNLANQKGTTPLLLAIEHGHSKVVQLLVEKGADPNQADKSNMTPFRRAEMLGNQEVLDALKISHPNSRLQALNM